MKKPLLSRLKKFNFVEPVLKELIIPDKEFKVSKEQLETLILGEVTPVEQYYLSVDNKTFMGANSGWGTAGELISHYYFAKGNVIATGMGFGIRENWLLNKKSVTSLTIIEKNKSVIDYHKFINSPFLTDKRVRIINCDANEYKGECDVLLADHYESMDNNEVLDEVLKLYNSKKIKHKLFWFWPLERLVTNFLTYNNLLHIFPTLPLISFYKLDYFKRMYFYNY